MLGELARANAAVDKALEEFRLNEAATALYEFIWGIVCDWYVELTKPILQGADGPEKDETRAVTAFVLRETVKLLHPVMPFITAPPPPPTPSHRSCGTSSAIAPSTAC